MPKIIYLSGVTCVGKDYVIDHCMTKYPYLYDAVQVGKIFRQRYPAGHFKGKGAMQSTEVEALVIFEEELARCLTNGKQYIFVAGQPRLLSQISLTIDKNPGDVLWLHCDEETQAARMRERFKGDAESMQLAQQRVMNDRYQLYDVLWELNNKGHVIFSTTSQRVIDSVEKYHGDLHVGAV